jgi:hypothetical protein
MHAPTALREDKTMDTADFDALRATGHAPPHDWGFILDEARMRRLGEIAAAHARSGQSMPPWAHREAQRLGVPMPMARLAA